MPPAPQGPMGQPSAPMNQPSAPTGQPSAPHAVQPNQGRPAPVRAGGIHLVGILTLVLMVIVGSWIGFRANRVSPASASVDSAWQKYGGGDSASSELTSKLRSEGFRCTDDAREDGTFRRFCGDYSAENSRSVEWAGDSESGAVSRVYIDMSPTGEGNRAVAQAAISAVVPDGPEREPAIALFQQPGASQTVEGPWGIAGYLPDGSFAATSSVPPTLSEARLLTGLSGVQPKAEAAGYTCKTSESTNALTCDRQAQDGQWTITVTDVDGQYVDVSAEVAAADVNSVDPAEELLKVIPDDPENRDARRWLEQAPRKQGSAGLWRGFVMEYRVNEAGGTVRASAGTTCHPVAPGETEYVC